MNTYSRLRFILPIGWLLGILTIANAQNRLSESYETKFSHEIAAEIKSGHLRKSSAAYYYSYIGEYENALKTYDLPLAWDLDTLTIEDSLYFHQFHPVNAFNYLAEKTKEEQIVIISEAHHKPQHRVFTTRLLKELYENGFRYFGVETLAPNVEDSTQFLLDTLLHERGYPTNSRLTGFYTREPQMGNMIREAIQLGFEVFAYEKTVRKKERDLEQAKNIIRFLEEHPNEKVVVHCGWYHAIESDFPKRKKDNYMAYHLKRISGIDPLTIYQDALSEKKLLPESPFYKKIKAETISVLINEDGKAFNGKNGDTHFDLLIYHPRTRYINNRPDWLFEIVGNQFVSVDRSRVSDRQYPILAKAFYLEETIDPTPVDIIEFKSINDNTNLVLKSGRYRIVLVDKENNSYEYFETVK